MNPVGRPELYHYVVEIIGVNEIQLEDIDHLLSFSEEISNRAQLPIVSKLIHKFEPIGTTLLFVLSVSHLSIHTWPENQYIHIDLLSCKKLPSNFRFVEVVEKYFGATMVNIIELEYISPNL